MDMDIAKQQTCANGKTGKQANERQNRHEHDTHALSSQGKQSVSSLLLVSSLPRTSFWPGGHVPRLATQVVGEFFHSPLPCNPIIN